MTMTTYIYIHTYIHIYIYIAHAQGQEIQSLGYFGRLNEHVRPRVRMDEVFEHQGVKSIEQPPRARDPTAVNLRLRQMSVVKSASVIQGSSTFKLKHSAVAMTAKIAM